MQHSVKQIFIYLFYCVKKYSLISIVKKYGMILN